MIKGKPVYRFLNGAACGNRSRVPIRLVPGEFVKAVRKAGVNEIAQILETELFEDRVRSSVLRVYKGHDPGELQIAEAIFQHGSGGFSGVSLAPKFETQAITQFDFSLPVKIERFDPAGADEFSCFLEPMSFKKNRKFPQSAAIEEKHSFPNLGRCFFRIVNHETSGPGEPVVAHISGQNKLMVDLRFLPIPQNEAFGFQHHFRTSHGLAFASGSLQTSTK